MTPAIALLLLLTAAPSDFAPSCATNLALLERQMHENYAGYTLELRGDRLRRFAIMKGTLQARVERTTGDSCFFVLRGLVDWFDDPHLFVYQNARVDSAETRRRAATVEHRNVTEASARAYFQRRGARLDPIEGIWYDRGLRVAVVPNSASGEGRFIAVLLASDTATWTPGSVRAHITRRHDGSYDVDLAARNYSIAHLHGAIYRHVLLRLSPGMWGKAFPVPGSDSGTLDPIDPHRPTVYRRNGTLVFAIPSMDGFKSVIDSMVARMQAHPGELVPVDDPAAAPSPADPRDWVVTSGPRAVGVITDRGTVSAAEVLVLYALQSPRATVFGEATAGALDYESVSIIPLSAREHRWALGYGTITRTADLPRGGMRGKGIPPQVHLDLAKLTDPVGFVDRALAKRH